MQYGQQKDNFDREKRKQIKILKEKDQKSYEQIAQELDLTIYDVMNEYLCWSSQDNWSMEDRQKLITEYNSGKNLQELKNIFPNRSIIGIHGKLLTSRKELNRELEQLPEDQPLCLRTVELAKICQYKARYNEDYQKELQQLKQMIQKEKKEQ